MINLKIAELYCKEDVSYIENYELAVNDNTQTWCCHHRAEILPCGRYKAKHLIKNDLYFNRPASELIFLTRAQHNQVHTKGREVSACTRKKISKANIGKPGPNLGKKFSKETCRRISESLRGKPSNRKGTHHTEETKRRMSLSMKGRKAWNKSKKTNYHWYTDGVANIQAKKCPEGFAPGRTLIKN